MLRSEEERERKKQSEGEYRDYEEDDDDDDDEDDGEEEEEDDYEDDIEEEEEEDEDEDEDESQHYYDDAYNDAEGKEYDSIAEYDYGYGNDSNESGRSEDEQMEDRSFSNASDEESEESDGSNESESDEEQDETYYDGDEVAEEEHNNQAHLSTLSSSSMYDDDASVYRDYHQNEQRQVSEGGYQDHLHQSAPPPPPPPEPSREDDHRSSEESVTNSIEDNQYFLDAVPERKMTFGPDYSDDSNHLFGYPANHNIGNSSLHRQATQMASYDTDSEGASMAGYLPASLALPGSSTHKPNNDEDRGPSELLPTFVNTDDYQRLQHHQQQEQQYHHQQQQLDYGNNNELNVSPETVVSQASNQLTFHSNPAEQTTPAQGGVSATTTTTIGATRPRSSFLALPGPISTYWKRLKRGSSSTPSSRPPSYPP
ncbi:hypothetical protein BG015_002767 [Linnemannia schmuckeri]|uniref:Uncharacterized protein n=1 Tax=Linnemannia schmuckeri TaxID=64567 RepID=A0A9P5RND1_9FUNG|nr:hypothetical protein BG015_002767 [Linnemannia schmuckeri]